MVGGQDAQATVSSPPGVKIIRAGVKIPREILTPGGQAARRYLDPRGASCQGVKINRYTGSLRFSQCYFTTCIGYNTNCIGAVTQSKQIVTNTVIIVTNTLRKVTLPKS